MNKTVFTALAVALVLGTLMVGKGAPSTAAKGTNILEFDSMVGVPAALTGAAGQIRGINGAGIAWMIGPSSGELKTGGKLEILVNDLVFAAGPNASKNTIPNFGVKISCLKADGTVQNVDAGLFPATVATGSDPGGDARIEASLSLPQPCIAPLIFITSPGGAWFATIGR